MSAAPTAGTLAQTSGGVARAISAITRPEGEIESVGVRDLLETEALRRRRRRDGVVRVRAQECVVLLARPPPAGHVEPRTDEEPNHMMEESIRFDVENEPAGRFPPPAPPPLTRLLVVPTA